MTRRIRRLQTNFAGGQIDARAQMRSETRMWQTGAKDLRNNQLLIEGGVRRRPGSAHCCITALTANARLRGFVFSLTQSYIIGFDNTTWAAFDGITGAPVTSGTGAPWTTAMLPALSFTQEGDTMIITHEDMPTQRLLRTGASSFTLSEMEFEENTEGTLFAQPYQRFGLPNVYFTPAKRVLLALNAASGSGTPTGLVTGGTSTATGTVDKTTTIGTTLYAWLTTPSSGTFQAGETVTFSGGSRTVQAVLAGQRLTSSAAAFTSGDLGTIWRMGYSVENLAADELVDRWFEQEVLAYDSTTVIWTHDRRGLPTWANIRGEAASESLFLRRQYEAMPWWTGTPADSDQIPTDIWEEPAFSAKRGYPRACTFHGQRLVLAGHKLLQGNYWLSRVAAYFNFDTGTGEPDASIQSAVGTGLGHTLVHAVSHADLLLLSDRGEFYIPESPTRPLTPDSGANALQQTAFGSSLVPPVPFDNAVLYIQGNGRTVREIKYTEYTDTYTADPINLVVRGLFAADVTDLAVIYGGDERPEQYAYLLTEDGKIACFHGNRVEEIAGWVPWDTNGSFTALCAVSTRLFVLAARVNDGVTEYHLEVFSDDCTTDATVDFTAGAPTTTVNGLDHLVGAEVAVVSGNLLYGLYTVDSAGEVELTEPLESCQVGLDYTRTIETLPPHFEDDKGSTVGEKIRVVAAQLRLFETVDCVVSGTRILVRNVDFDPSEALDPISGDRLVYLNGWSIEPTVTITQEAPLPLTVLACVIEYLI